MTARNNCNSVMIFWGCMISAVEPFVEKATRYSMEKLRIDLEEMSNATCCPDPEISRTLGADLWLTLAGRNISIANKAKKDICVICNGCFDTLFKSNYQLKQDQDIINQTKTILKKYDREFDGSSKIFHMIEFLHDVVGIDTIRAHIVKHLPNLRCVPQYGCRILREDLGLTLKFDNLIEALGAKLVHTKTERLCCGVPSMYANPDFALHERAEIKLKEIQDSKADCIVLFCPACAERLERAEVTLRKEGKDFQIPVVNYLELLAISFGASPSDIGTHLHRVSLESLLYRINDK